MTILGGVHVDPEFEARLAHLDLASLSASDDVVFAVDDAYVLRAHNPAWLTFATDNGGAETLTAYPLGTSILPAIATSIRHYVTRLYVLAMESGLPSEHVFECSSPGVFRRFRQVQVPLPGKAGWLVTNECVEARPHTREPHAWSKRFLDGAERTIQCSHCRRTLDHHSGTRWEWVPSVVARPRPRTRFELCPDCSDHYRQATRLLQ